MTSYITLEQLTEKILNDLRADVIPDVLESGDLLINCLTLTKLNESCSLIGKELIKMEARQPSDPQLHEVVKSRLQRITATINFELFKNQQIIKQEEEALMKASEMPVANEEEEFEIIEMPKEEDENELRKRLFESNNEDLRQELNEHHENLQQEIMNDFAPLVNYLKDAAYKLQHLVEEDKHVMDKAENNLSNTQSQFNLNSLNLSRFHKQGKLSYWEMAKILFLFVVMILFTMFIITIF